MALIEVFHVVASHHPIDADGTPDIYQGMIVRLNPSTGNTQLHQAAGNMPMGIAGDTRSSTDGSTPENANLPIGADGASTRLTQNRVSDFYNEALASGRMTIYHGGGEFWTDQYASVRDDNSTVTAFAIGAYLYSTYAGTPTGQNGGLWTDDATGGKVIAGIVIGEPQLYPSGVPGTQIDGHLAWGTFLNLRLQH